MEIPTIIAITYIILFLSDIVIFWYTLLLGRWDDFSVTLPTMLCFGIGVVTSFPNLSMYLYGINY